MLTSAFGSLEVAATPHYLAEPCVLGVRIAFPTVPCVSAFQNRAPAAAVDSLVPTTA